MPGELDPFSRSRSTPLRAHLLTGVRLDIARRGRPVTMSAEQLIAKLIALVPRPAGTIPLRSGFNIESALGIAASSPSVVIWTEGSASESIRGHIYHAVMPGNGETEDQQRFTSKPNGRFVVNATGSEDAFGFGWSEDILNGGQVQWRGFCRRDAFSDPWSPTVPR